MRLFNKITTSLIIFLLIYLAVGVTFLSYQKFKIIAEPPTGKFLVPFYFPELSIPPSTRDHPYLVGNLSGAGTIEAIAFHAGYYGLTIGYQADEDPTIHWINNGNCLFNWGATSFLALDFPVRLLSWKNLFDLDIGIKTPLRFHKKMKIYFENSADKNYSVSSLHLYGYFSNLSFGKNNFLKV